MERFVLDKCHLLLFIIITVGLHASPTPRHFAEMATFLSHSTFFLSFFTVVLKCKVAWFVTVNQTFTSDMMNCVCPHLTFMVDWS